MQPSTLHFAALCQSLQKLETLSSAPGNTAASRTLLRRLIAAARASGDLYAVARLLIPKRDLERQHYNMKESALAAILTEALGLAADSKDGILLSNWKRTDNAAAGDFARIASEVTGERQFRKICQLSISDFNLLLDRLAATSGRKERVGIFMELIEKTTAKEIKWVVRFILKDVKIGLGENSILDVIHQDAKAMMATCIDLKRVCMQLHNPSARFVLQELVLGKVVKSQHSKRMNSIELTWEAMKRKDVVVECKFDGDRMQVHKDGTRLWFWSRNGKEHQEYSIPLGEALCHSIISDRCVLDGELLVLDRFENRFKPRTKTLNHDAARAARKGLETDDLVCYMIFDILYEGEQGSVLHYPLRKRRELLKTVIQPGFSPQVFCTATENSKWSLIPACEEELTDFFLRTIEMGDEGIVVKDLDSKWSPDNRDGRWCKIKPDYVSMGSDLDLLIIGGYYGTGSHGGKIVSFLLALVDEIEGCASSRFVSICRCGRGLSDEELALLQNKISPYIVKNNKGGKPPATCGYLVTNNRYECPDIWILKPEMSIVLQISSERRIYRTQTFKAGWTFRFPRIVKVRYDKCWNEALRVKEFEEMVSIAKVHGNSLLGGPHKYNPIPIKSRTKRGKESHKIKHLAVLPHLQSSDVSHVRQIDNFFQGLVFYICNTTNFHEKDNLSKEIKSCGGESVFTLVKCATHVIAADKKGLQFKIAATNDRDIITLSWLVECIKSRTLLHVSPRHYLHLSLSTKKKLEQEIDKFGDPWFEPIGTEDLHQIFENLTCSHLREFTCESKPLQRRRLGAAWQWDLFQGCCIFFHRAVHSMNPDSQLLGLLTLKRLGLEAEMRGASLSCVLDSSVTHIIVYVPPCKKMSFSVVLRSFEASDRQLVQSTQMRVISHCWLEGCLKEKRRLDLDSFTLRENINIVTKSAVAPDVHSKSHLEGAKNPYMTSVTLEESYLPLSSTQEHEAQVSTSISHAKSSWNICSAGEEGQRTDLVPLTVLPDIEKGRKRLRRENQIVEGSRVYPRCRPPSDLVTEKDFCAVGNNFEIVECYKSEDNAVQQDRESPKPDHPARKSAAVGKSSQSVEEKVDKMNQSVKKVKTQIDLEEPNGNFCSRERKLSEQIWASQSLQDIAQMYMGSTESSSSTSLERVSGREGMIDTLNLPAKEESHWKAMNLGENQIFQCWKLEDTMKAGPASIPKRRFTAKDYFHLLT